MIRILIEKDLRVGLSVLIERAVTASRTKQREKFRSSQLEQIRAGAQIHQAPLLQPLTLESFPPADDAISKLKEFFYERLKSLLRDQGYAPQEIDAVVSLRPAFLADIPKFLAAVRAFAGLPEAESLAAANKRVANILKQAEAKGEAFSQSQVAGFKEKAEYDLFDALKKVSDQATPLLEQGDFTGYLKTFAVLKTPVDAYFESVMVMVDDPEVRRNRLALLRDLRDEMNRIADISKLAA